MDQLRSGSGRAASAGGLRISMKGLPLIGNNPLNMPIKKG